MAIAFLFVCFVPFSVVTISCFTALAKDFQEDYQWQQFDLKDQLGLGLDHTSFQVTAVIINQ